MPDRISTEGGITLRTARRFVLCTFLALAFPASALAATSAGQPFPSNLFTIEDSSQVTGLRVNLAKPDCAARPNDCADIDVLNSLDGFNIQPRISVPFSAPINPATVSSATIFLLGPAGDRIGINQVVWETAANTLHFESDEQLAQSTPYLLVVTDGVRGADGEPLDGTRFRHELNFGQTNDPVAKAYRKSLLDALELARAAGVKSSEIATASLFTTQTITAISNKIRAQIQGAAPPIANFVLGTNGERTVFPLTSITAVQWNRQLGTASFGNTLLPVPALSAFGATVGTVAFGSFASRDYETAEKVIPAVGTATGIPVVQSTNTLGLHAVRAVGLRAGGRLAGRDVRARLHRQPRRRAVGGCVVAREPRPRVDRDQRGGTRRRAARPLHGAPNSGALPQSSSPTAAARSTRTATGGYDSTEGVNAVAANALIGNRDGLRQTVVDLMQLVRMLQGGVDVDADGGRRPQLLADLLRGPVVRRHLRRAAARVEPAVRAGVANVPGGPIIEIARLSPVVQAARRHSARDEGAAALQHGPQRHVHELQREHPLRNEPIRIDTVPGASAIQALIDNTEWAQQAANPAAYAPHVDCADHRPVRARRPDGAEPDDERDHPGGDLAVTDDALPARHRVRDEPGARTSKNPHGFLTSIANAFAPFAVAAQTQLATFLASDGTTTIDPDGAGAIFETPTSMVPEDLAYIP